MSEDLNMKTGPDYSNLPDSTPPEEPDGAPSPTYSADVSPTGPLPLGDAVRQLPGQYIKVLTRPSASLFAQEQDKAAWDITWIQILIASVVAVIVAFVLFNLSVPTSNTPASIQTNLLLRTHAAVFALSYIVLEPVFFFMGVGLFHLLARAFGGVGTFLAYCYCTLLYWIPLGIIGGILSIILYTFIALLGLSPYVSSFLSTILLIYGLVMQIFVTMGVHRLSGGKATLAVIIVPIILFVLAFVLFLGAIVILLANFHH